jgi:hypothetical protein
MIARTPYTSLQKLTLSTKLGLVSVPDAKSIVAEAGVGVAGFDRKEARELLEALGRDLGMTLLTAKAETFLEEGSVADTTVIFSDEAIRKTVEGLDVVWMQGNEIIAAFVIEGIAGSWEGLRRLADLIALNPKLKSAFYAITLHPLKAGLLSEMHRPMYRLLKKPLAEAVRVIDWSRLQSEVTQLGERVRYLKPEFLEGISDVPEVPALD